MVNKLYGIDYNKYVCGGIGSPKLALYGSDRELFYSESEMLKRLSELKSDITCGDFGVFITNIVKEKYEI